MKTESQIRPMPQTIRRMIIQEIKMPIRGIILIVIAAVIAVTEWLYLSGRKRNRSRIII